MKNVTLLSFFIPYQETEAEIGYIIFQGPALESIDSITECDNYSLWPRLLTTMLCRYISHFTSLRATRGRMITE